MIKPRHGAKHFIIMSFDSHNHPKGGAITIPISWLRKLRHAEVKPSDETSDTELEVRSWGLPRLPHY